MLDYAQRDQPRLAPGYVTEVSRCTGHSGVPMTQCAGAAKRHKRTPVCAFTCDRGVSVLPVRRSSEEAQEFASLCIAREPHQRPSPSQLCPGGEADLDAAHPFIAVGLELQP